MSAEGDCVDSDRPITVIRDWTYSCPSFMNP